LAKGRTSLHPFAQSKNLGKSFTLGEPSDGKGTQLILIYATLQTKIFATFFEIGILRISEAEKIFHAE
jgi:hypothetical protein